VNLTRRPCTLLVPCRAHGSAKGTTIRSVSGESGTPGGGSQTSRPPLLAIAYAVASVVFVAAGVLAVSASWSGHYYPTVGFLLVAVVLTVISVRLRAGKLIETLDAIWLWGLLGLVAGLSAGTTFEGGVDSGWRFVVGVIVGAAVIGILRWYTSTTLDKGSTIEKSET